MKFAFRTTGILFMGHVRDDVASLYGEKISDDLLRRVTEHVRQWLFGTDDNIEEGNNDHV